MRSDHMARDGQAVVLNAGARKRICPVDPTSRRRAVIETLGGSTNGRLYR